MLSRLERCVDRLFGLEYDVSRLTKEDEDEYSYFTNEDKEIFSFCQKLGIVLSIAPNNICLDPSKVVCKVIKDKGLTLTTFIGFERSSGGESITLTFILDPWNSHNRQSKKGDISAVKAKIMDLYSTDSGAAKIIEGSVWDRLWRNFKEL